MRSLGCLRVVCFGEVRSEVVKTKREKGLVENGWKETSAIKGWDWDGGAARSWREILRFWWGDYTLATDESLAARAGTTVVLGAT